MSHLKAKNPIGIFDSGVGGLTVAKSIMGELPNENLIYFGDTAHFPYGDKSAETIRAYTKEIVDFLLSKNCKMIVIACNSASAAAFPALKKYIGKRAILINVIDPVIDHVSQHFPKKTVGLIATRQTVYSHVYSKKLKATSPRTRLKALATPLLVSAIEEMFSKPKIIEAILKEYLLRPILKNIRALILGCTHYPVIAKHIARFYRKKLTIIDPGEITAKQIKKILKQNQLENKHGAGLKQVYVSDYTESFDQATRLFFGKKIHPVETSW